MKAEHKKVLKKLGKQIKSQMKAQGMSVDELQAIIDRPNTEEEEREIQKKNKELGALFRQKREEQKLSLEELSKRSNVSIGVIQRVEAGLAGKELITVFFDLANAMGGRLGFEPAAQTPEKKKAAAKKTKAKKKATAKKTTKN